MVFEGMEPTAIDLTPAFALKAKIRIIALGR
jgi:hypothetical protein